MSYSSLQAEIKQTISPDRCQFKSSLYNRCPKSTFRLLISDVGNQIPVVLGRADGAFIWVRFWSVEDAVASRYR